MTSKRKFHIPSADEDAAITAAALSDPDNPPLTDDQLNNLRPAREVLPGMIGETAAAMILRRPGRPTKPPEEHKVRTTMRLDPDVLAAFKETGPGWQSRVNDALRDWAKSHRMLAQ
jgi:uncharacterized protein (DUF4415 family)